MDQTAVSKNFGFDTWTSSFSSIEFSDSSNVAIITIPLMHKGANAKFLYWKSDVLKKVTPLFKEVTFRYDLNGQEGSSHAIAKLSSPFFDVGWTNDSWFDEKTNILWVKGEVTNPQVVEKLKRKTSDGKREVNYASMGIMISKAVCSICGEEYDEICINGHERGQEYNGETCYKVPIEAQKGLHVALTNDPADGEAEIEDCIFQELGGKMINFNSMNNPSKTDQVSPNQIQSPIKPMANQLPEGMACSAPAVNQGMMLSPEDILKDLAERIKTIEAKIAENNMQQPAPEVINTMAQDSFTQDNMGNTTQFEGENNMDASKGQTSNNAAPVNVGKPSVEMQNQVAADPMSQMMEMLKQILARLPATGVATQDLNELTNAGKKDAEIDSDESKDVQHLAPGDAVSPEAESHESNKKNKEGMTKPESVAIADNSKELADMREQIKSLRSKLEIQDDSDISEFGGINSKASVEVQDMSADDRAKKFGDFGKYDAIFNGAKSAERFRR